MGRKAQPVPRIYQSEVSARAIYFGAFNPGRQMRVGFPTVKANLANRIAPGLIDRCLAKSGYSGQLTEEPSDPNAPSRHRDALSAVAFAGLDVAARLLAKRLKV